MSKPREEFNDEGVAEAAATWFVRLQGDTASGDDWQGFELWLQAAPAHVQAYERLEQLWVDLDDPRGELAAALDAPRASPRRARAAPQGRRAPRRAWLAAGGAIAASLVAAAVFLAQAPTQTAAATVYQAPAGQTRTVRLADGTRVRLNAASSLSVSFDADARRVTVADAEAAFDVTHDPKRPFLITVGDSQVRVVGTEFNLRHREGATELTVRRGVVEVKPGAGATQAYRVAAGQQLGHRDGTANAVIASVQPDDAFAWTQGQLVYRDRPMSEVAADLSRRFGRPVSTADPRTAQLRFTGVLVTDSEPAVLHRLESFAPVKAVSTPDGVVLRGR